MKIVSSWDMIERLRALRCALTLVVHSAVGPPHEDPRVSGQGDPRGSTACPSRAAKSSSPPLTRRRPRFALRLAARSVVKAQIHAGGRGKGGGVKVVKGAGRGREGVAEDASACSSSPTRPARKGSVVERVLVEAGPQHHPRALPGHRHRSRDGAAGADGQPGRRRRDRESRARDAGAHLQGVHRSRRSACRRTRPASSRSPSA